MRVSSGIAKASVWLGVELQHGHAHRPLHVQIDSIPPGVPLRDEHAPAFTESGYIARHATRGGAVALVAQAINFAMSFFCSVLLARMLAPEDFGLVAMATGLTGLLRIFRDGGLSNATVQRASISEAQISALFWLNCALGVALALVAALSAPLIARFFARPELVGVILGLAVTFLLGSVAVQHEALLRRQMRFVAIAVVEVFATAVGAVVGLVMASRGYGYWSLVGLAIASTCGSVAAIHALVRWLPGWPRRCAIGPLVRFGSAITAGDVVQYVFRQADNILIGWRWGAGALGLYARAYGLLMLVINQINAPLSDVAVSTLSRLQSEPETMRRYFLNAYALIAAVTLPLCSVLVVFADDVVLFLLGPQWEPSVLLFRLLAPAALVGALLDPFTWMFIACGQAARQLRVRAAWTGLVIAAFVLGLPYGAAGVAACFSGVSVLLAWPFVTYALRHTGLAVRELLQQLKAPALSTLAAAVLGVAAKFLLQDADLVLRALLGPMITLGVYAFALLGIFGQWSRYRNLVQRVLATRRRQRTP